MPEAVIVATARTPIGRANKGSLVDVPPRRPLRADHRERARQGAASSTRRRSKTSSGAAGSRPVRLGSTSARVAAILAGVDVPGVTVNRYCSSSLQTIRMAAHAIKAGEGDVFVSGGVETVSRFASGAADTGGLNDDVRTTRVTARRQRTAGGQPPWTPPAGLPDVYIAMGQTAENVVEAENVDARRDGRVGRRVAEARRRRAGERVLRAGDHARHAADGTVVSKDDGPRPGTTIEKLRDVEAGVPPRRQGDGRQRLSAQRRRGGGGRDERHEGGASSASRRWRASSRAA